MTRASVGALHQPRWAMVAGLAGGLAIATKETAVVVLPSVVVACLIATRSAGPASRGLASPDIRWLVGGAVLGACTAAPFFSSFLTVPAGVLEPLAGVGTYLDRGIAPAYHAQPLVAGFVVGSAHLGWQSWRASVLYAADQRNPYVYAQTVPDAERMAKRIRALAAQHPDGDGMRVSVVAPPDQQWPLPWYLRTMPNVGYWVAPGEAAALEAPVVVAAVAHTDAVDTALGERYVSEFHGLRPEVLLALYIERELWDRFLVHAAGAP